MNKNEVEKCYCEIGFQKGAIKKSCEFENFSIFGNLMKKNTIVIRYNGSLAKNNIEKKNHKIILYYVFNNDWTNKKELVLANCEHDKGCYCTSIDLEDNLNITFGFCNNLGEYDKDLSNSYSLKIANNTIDDIMKRYGMEANTDLPVPQAETNDINNCFNIFNKIKNYILNIFKKRNYEI